MTKHYDKLWNLRFQQLEEYIQTHAGNNCTVPCDYVPIPELGRWVREQRTRQRQKKMSVEREERLNAIGFDWKTQRTDWNTRFQQLEEYKKANGDCNVPTSRRSQSHIDLGRWVVEQRYRKKSAQLSEEREAKLNVIGFVWEVHADWNTRFQHLEEYKKANGDCNVSKSNSSQHIDLGRWVANQRSRKKSAQLGEERWSQLDSIGFDWGKQATTRTTNDPVIRPRETRVAELSSEDFETRENQWETHFRELLEHFQANRDFNVHQYCPLNPLLVGWVSEQRNDYDLKGRCEQTSLTPLREAKLNAIGFAWFVDGDDSSSSSSRDASAEDVV